MIKNPKEAERNLYFSIWIFIVLGFGIWFFWPSSLGPPKQLTAISLEGGLEKIFEAANVIEEHNSKYIVQLDVAGRYLAKIQDERKVIQLRYQLWGNRSLLYDNQTSCLVIPGQTQTLVKLSNPNLISARRIVLRLLH